MLGLLTRSTSRSHMFVGVTPKHSAIPMVLWWPISLAEFSDCSAEGTEVGSGYPSARGSRLCAVVKTSHVHCRELPVQAERHVLDVPNIAPKPEQEDLIVAALAALGETTTPASCDPRLRCL